MRASSSAAPAPVSAPISHADDLQDLVSVLALEAGELARCADGLQRLFGQLMAGPPTRPPEGLERAQSLDALVQRLQGLETFLTALSKRPLEDVSMDAQEAARELSLASQATRFSSRRPAAAAAAGECDLF